MKNILSILTFSVLLASCSENYSNGERIGMVTQFSERGLIYKSWEGHLNVTQTGMNSSTGFDFSVDNDKPDPKVIGLLDSAANQGWKVKLVYHQVAGLNWFKNRGETDYFIESVSVLDRNPVGHIFSGQSETTTTPVTTGRVVDTIYVLVVNGEKFPLAEPPATK